MQTNWIMKKSTATDKSASHFTEDVLLKRIKSEFQHGLSQNELRKDPLRKYQLLYHCLKSLILQKALPEGINMPASRVLAEALELSRSTINKALELLLMEGFIESKQGSGVFIKEKTGYLPTKKPPTSNAGYPELSEIGNAFSSSVKLINSTDDKSIAFRPGIPPLDIFPVNGWKNLSNLYWRHIKTSEMIYSPASGLESVKKSIANYLNITRNIQCSTKNIIIVAGSLQSLYLVGNVLVNPGDRVLIENPTFPNVRAIFNGLRAKVQTSKIDSEGIQIPSNADSNAPLKIIHCTPSCQYPIGTVMSLERRKQLIQYARTQKSLIIENDYEHEVNTSQGALPSIYSLDGGERTIYLGTFNRLLHPSIRIGYIVVPDYLSHAMESLLKHSHRFVPPSLQVVLSQFIDKRYIFKHIKKINQVAEERKKVFISHFEEYFPNHLQLLASSTPSLHLSALINQKIADKDIVQMLNNHHLICHPLSRCFEEKESMQGLIFGYASVRTPVIKQKLIAMARLIKAPE